MSGDDVFFAFALAAPLLLGRATYLFFRLVVRSRELVPWPALLAGNLLVFATILATLVLAGESWFRFAVDTTDGDAQTKATRRWYERHWQTNALGMRDDIDYPMRRKGVGRRITFFGDSFTNGHGIANLSDRFVNRIREARPEWEVHGIAAGGASTKSELDGLYNLLARGYEIETVVLVYCFNDIDPFVTGLDPIYASLTRRPPALLKPVVAHSYLGSALFYYWKLWRTASNPQLTNYFEMIEDAYRGEPWQKQKAVLAEFAGAVHDAGGQMLAVTFPQFVHLGRGEDEDHVMHGLLAEAWEELGVPHLDLLPLMRKHRGGRLVVSRFDDHPSAFAHGLAAEAMIEFIAAHPPPHEPGRANAP